MTNVIFVNPDRPECGVFQMGLALFDILSDSTHHNFVLKPLSKHDEIADLVRQMPCDVVLWNWHPTIDSYLKDGPPAWQKCKNILIKHEPTPHEEKYTRVIFSDPTEEDHDRVRHIGRPLPRWQPKPVTHTKSDRLTVGIHGFQGAQAHQVVRALALSEDGITGMHFRVHLPYSPYVDPDGKAARGEVDLISEEIGGRIVTLEARHDFMPMDELIDWLAMNDVNCYVREKAPSPGVSSALDAALVCGKPIAINKCEAFRHFWHCEPSICLEDRSLKDIISSGDEPLRPLREKWSRENILAQVEKIIAEVL